MIGKLNHIAIAVPNLVEASSVYNDILGAKVSEPIAMPEHGVTTVFVELPNTKIELLEALGEDSPIAKFIENNPKGGMHHICYEVEDIFKARDEMIAKGITVLGSGEPKNGAHNKPVIFMHPKDFMGTLIELEQV
jgi:methylmalonyl-CoA/ethylmalonyl-CoA epimerase